MSSIWGELKRRKLVQVTAVYVVVAWLVMQIVDVVNQPLNLPEWFATVVIVLLAIGLPVTLVMSWAFDVTPHGVVRDTGRGGTVGHGRTIELVLIGLIVVAVGWLVYRVELDGSESSAAATAPTLEREVMPNSVAVLPFDNLSPDPNNAFFASGIHDELLNQLAKIRDLNVIARTSVLRYAGGELSIPEIAAELNVETIMEGTVRYADGSVRITTQLIDAVTEAHLWSETYTRPFENVFEIETDIAMRIADALEAQFSLAEQESIANQAPSTSPEAFAIYVRAMDLWQSSAPTAEILASVGADLRRVVAIDPGFAQPYAVLADIRVEQLVFDVGTAENWRTRRVELENLVVSSAERALELDPNLGYAHAALGKLHELYRRGREAREAFERAIALSPNDPEVLIEAAWFHAFVGEHAAAMRLAERAVELDPNNSDLWNRLGMVFSLAKELDRGLTAQRNAIELNPANYAGHLMAAFLEARRGNAAVAVADVSRGEQLAGDTVSAFVLGQIAYGYGMAGDTASATRLHARLETVANARRVGPVPWALAHLGVGDERRALDMLSAAAADSSPDDGAFFVPLFTHNFWDDPRLEQPEFVAVRNRLAYTD